MKTLIRMQRYLALTSVFCLFDCHKTLVTTFILICAPQLLRKLIIVKQVTCLIVTSCHKWPKSYLKLLKIKFSNTMRLASHGMRQDDGLKYHEIFLPILRYGMYEYHDLSTLSLPTFAHSSTLLHIVAHFCTS